MTQSVERGWDLQSQRVGGPPADILGSQLALIPMSYAGVSFFLCRVHTTNKQRINVSSAELLPKQTPSKPSVPVDFNEERNPPTAAALLSEQMKSCS